MNKRILFTTLALASILPIIASAVTLPDIPNQIGDIGVVINGILNLIWPLFIGFAVIMFITAGFLFVRAQGEPSELKVARDCLIWGVVGVVVAVLAFTIPYYIQNVVTTGNVGTNGAVNPTCSNLGAACTADASCCGFMNAGVLRTVCFNSACRLCKGSRVVCAVDGECCNGRCAPAVNTGATTVCN